MIHNASVEKYRTPVGAVTCGSEMMIRLYDVGQEVNKAEIIMYSESFHREYEMKRKKDCMEEHIKMTSEAGVVWYYLVLFQNLGTWEMLFLWSQTWEDTRRRNDR